MLGAENSALVAGAASAPAAPAGGVTVRIVRAVMVGGYCVEPGRELVVDRYMAAQLVTSNKAVRVPAPAAQQPKPAAKAAKEKNRAQQ